MARRKRASFLSKQAPASVAQRARRILSWLGAVVAVLILLLIIAYFFFMSWLQGDGFRQHLTNALSQFSGAAKVSVPQNMTLDGQHMTLPECVLRDAPLFRELRLRKLHMEVDRGALLQRWLKFRHLSVEELQLTLGTADPQAGETAEAGALPPNAPGRAQRSTPRAADTAPAVAPQSGGFIKGIQAPTFESHYTVTTLRTGAAGKERFSLSGYYLIATPKLEGNRTTYNLTVENGRILTPFSWLRESGLKSAKLTYSGDTLTLNQALVLLTPGELRAHGAFHPAGGDWNAEVDIQQADVSRLLNDDWRKRLTGRLTGSLRMKGRHPGAWQAGGSIRLEKGLLEGLPILSELKLDNTRPYRSLPLEKATCNISYPYADPQHSITDAWLWDNIDIRTADGSLLIRGRIITGNDGALSGALDIGIPAKTFAALGLNKTPAVKQLFNAPVHIPGYVWVHINLSGSVTAPQEDLSVRLATILPQALPDMADQAVKSLDSVLSSFLPNKERPSAAKDTAPDEDADNDEPAPATPAAEPAKQLQNVIRTGLDILL